MSANSTGARLWRFSIALGLAASVTLAFAGCKPKPAVPERGQIVPPTEFTAAFLKENSLQGRIVLIEFGLVGCERSDKGLDEMIRLCRDKSIQDLACVRVEGSKDRAAADLYYEAKKPGFPVYRDSDASVTRAFDATAYPTFVLLDRFARVRYHGGMPDEAQLSGWVASLLSEKADPGPYARLFGEAKPELSKLLASTKLPDLQGDVKSLQMYMGRRGLLLVFVDTTCPFSGTAIGDMPNVAGKLAAQGVSSVLVNIGDARSEVLPFYAEQKTGTPVVYDGTDATMKNWGVDSVPTVFFVDTKGNVAYRGNAVWQDLAPVVEKTLKLSAGTIRFDAQGTEFG